MYRNIVCNNISVAGGLLVAIVSYFFVYGVEEFVNIQKLKV